MKEFILEYPFAVVVILIAFFIAVRYVSEMIISAMIIRKNGYPPKHCDVFGQTYYTGPDEDEILNNSTSKPINN